MTPAKATARSGVAITVMSLVSSRSSPSSVVKRSPSAAARTMMWAFPSLSLAWQLALFSITSIIYLLVLRRYMKRLFMGDAENSPGLASEFVGRVGKVIETIRPEVPGRIELGEVEWKASAGERLEPGTEVKVVAQDNLTLRVEKI